MRRLRLIDGADEGSARREDGHMKVAFATNDLKHVDAHFGGARSIAVYDISATSSRFLEAIQFDGVSVSAEDGSHDDSGEDRISTKIDALAGCSLVFVLAIGGPAAARVVNARVHPIKLAAPEGIPEVVARVQAMLDGNPPPWLRKVMKDESRNMDFLSEDA